MENINLTVWREFRFLVEYMAQLCYDLTSQSFSKNMPVFYMKKNGMTKSLFEVFLENIPSNVRNFYNTDENRDFINNYGNLALVASDGRIIPLMWNDVYYDGIFSNAIKECRKIVETSRIYNVFEFDLFRSDTIIEEDCVILGNRRKRNTGLYLLLNYQNLMIQPLNTNHDRKWFLEIMKEVPESKFDDED